MALNSLTQRLGTSVALAFILGALSVLAFAPFEAFPLLWLTSAGFYALLCRTRDLPRAGRRSALLGGSFGLGLFLSGVYWLFISMHTYGGMPALLAALLTLIFCAYLALYPALAAWAFVRLAPESRWLRGLLFAACLTLADQLRAWVFTGFPWLTLGYAQTAPSPLAGYLPILGVFGTTFATGLIGALIGEVLQACHWRQRLAAAIPAGLVLIVGGVLGQISWTSPIGAPLSVALLQGNIAQDLKWQPERFRETLTIYYRLARDNPAQLTVLPETAFPAFFEYLPGEYVEALKTLVAREQGNVLLGAVVGDNQRYANGAISLGNDPQQRYRKHHLVPFGEFIPTGFSWFLRLANIPMSSFAAGKNRQPPLQLSGQRVAVNICYEDTFGDELIDAVPEATILVNLSNIAWFGDSLAPAQHAQIARVRALESGRMMLRATNTGVTAIIDRDGSLQAALATFTRGALRGTVQGYTGQTPFVRTGSWPITVVSVLILGFLVFRQRAASKRK